MYAPSVSDEACEAGWLACASIIVRRKIFRDIGLLDEGYFTFYEDVDFCFNARKTGWKVWYVPASRVVHLVGRSTGLTVKQPKRQPAYAFQARRRYFLKNNGPLEAALSRHRKNTRAHAVAPTGSSRQARSYAASLPS